MAETTKPLLLICSNPLSGHFAPCKIIAKVLIERGYEVTFLTGSQFGPGVEAIGATFIPLEGYSNFNDSPSGVAEKWPVRETLQGPAQMLFDMEHMFLNSMTSQFESVQKALKLMTDKNPGRTIIMVQDIIFCGGFPLLAGEPGIKPAAVISLGIAHIVLASPDVQPMGSRLPPDSSLEGRERNLAMHTQMQNGPFLHIAQLFHHHLEVCGAKSPGFFFLDAPYLLPDRVIQLCARSVEYPRSDLPKTLVFSGGLPKSHKDVVSTTRPSWWDEVTTNASKKRIVFVSQGTVALNYEDLIIPTIEAFADHDNTIVIAALGVKGASLPDSVTVPKNVYVEDFLPFDDILPYCDVFITNGGYGGFQHGLSNGVPMVMGGDTEDKPENCARCEWIGVGVNLKTARPDAEFLRGEVEKVLSDQKYKKKVEEIKKEMESMDPIAIIEAQIEELVKEKSA
ncbi:hypothetical protein BOTCAL_0519g00070 [Botryotinia calthae]|uniref:Erythromycin biosynthesis protein CIII-like C-terminal domain-containing protein n=1 Tax=Botryotinia calthae TaxID=38488 RepID=A0A4Y8CKX9_9HELO|nr:hypothetical protein BOTCAL_0519g00070 [Botryotinia calthae]